jgi:hypothetical protein
MGRLSEKLHFDPLEATMPYGIAYSGRFTNDDPIGPESGFNKGFCPITIGLLGEDTGKIQVPGQSDPRAFESSQSKEHTGIGALHINCAPSPDSFICYLAAKWVHLHVIGGNRIQMSGKGKALSPSTPLQAGDNVVSFTFNMLEFIGNSFQIKKFCNSLDHFHFFGRHIPVAGNLNQAAGKFCEFFDRNMGQQLLNRDIHYERAPPDKGFEISVYTVSSEN